MIRRMISIVPSDMALSPKGGRRMESAAPPTENKAHSGVWFHGRNRERLSRLQFQRCGVDAVTQSGRAGPVLEHMAEVAVALRAKHFGPHHAVADVAFFVDMALRRWLRKARPSAAGIELGVGFEQRLSAAGAGIGAWRLLVLVFAGERPLGRLLAQHRILHRRQFLAPFRFALLDLAGHCLGVGHGASLNYETAVSW